MKIEHVAYQVQDPIAVAKWYSENLGLRVKRANETGPKMHFLADDGDHVMIELYHNPIAPLPDYRNQHALILHVAFTSDNIQADWDRLVAAGATVDSEPETTPAGDTVAMLRDPWGFCIQLVKRAEPMI